MLANVLGHAALMVLPEALLIELPLDCNVHCTVIIVLPEEVPGCAELMVLPEVLL